MTQTTPLPQERAKRLAVTLPNDIADEINESIEAFPDLNLSATTTQWLKALNTREACQLIENLSLQIMNEVKK